MEAVTARDITEVLLRWESGAMTSREVHEWANARFCTEQWEAENEIVNEVLAYLDTMDMNLVLPEDIPSLREALCAQSPEAVHRFIDDCYTKITIDVRKRKCAEDPLYAPFCK